MQFCIVPYRFKNVPTGTWRKQVSDLLERTTEPIFQFLQNFQYPPPTHPSGFMTGISKGSPVNKWGNMIGTIIPPRIKKPQTCPNKTVTACQKLQHVSMEMVDKVEIHSPEGHVVWSLLFPVWSIPINSWDRYVLARGNYKYHNFKQTPENLRV